MLSRRLLLATATTLPFTAHISSSFAQSMLNVPGPLGDKIMGDEKAPVTIIEYASLTCSHCASFHENTFPALKEKYIDKGKVRFILREFALDPLSAAAFMLSRCAPADKYFDMVGIFFKTQQTWARSNDPLAALLNMSLQTGFTKESFEACLKDQKLLDAVNDVRKQGEKNGVNATPTLFINGKKYSGAMDIAELDKVLEPLTQGK